MFETVREDLAHKAAIRGLPPELSSYARVCATQGTMAQLLYRAMRFCHTRHLGLPAMALYRLNGILCQAIIGRGADLGPGLVLVYGHGIVINSAVRAGKNLVVLHGVTLGEVRGESPVLGDDVYIGAGAKVIGKVRIGSRVRIGANAVVTRDLPDGATAVGVPARVVRIDGERVLDDVACEARGQA